MKLEHFLTSNPQHPLATVAGLVIEQTITEMSEPAYIGQGMAGPIIFFGAVLMAQLTGEITKQDADNYNADFKMMIDAIKNQPKPKGVLQ